MSDPIEGLEGSSASRKKKSPHEAWAEYILFVNAQGPIVAPSDSSRSTLEKSSAVEASSAPGMGMPTLLPPSMEGYAIVDRTAQWIAIKKDEQVEKLLEGWGDNIRALQEQMRQLLGSSFYQGLLAAAKAGTLAVTLEGGSIASVDCLSSLERFKHWSSSPHATEVEGSSEGEEGQKVLVLPLAGAMIAGGTALAGTLPVESITQAVETIQGLFPTVAIQDVVPLVNLMVMGPLYFHSWNEALQQMKDRKGRTHVAMIQKFAQDCLKISRHPDFILGIILSYLKGADQLSDKDCERLAAMLKVFLLGIALALMYAAEVGKAQDGQFGGIPVEELQTLLQGKWTDLSGKKELSPHEQLTASLIKELQGTLTSLSPKDREASLRLLFSYTSHPTSLKGMVEPSATFDKFLKALSF